MGGLTVIDLRIFNQILLLKWYWWWYASGHRLWKLLMSQMATIQEGRPLTTIFITVSAQMGDFFNNSTCWRPGDGLTISMWNHNWGKGFMKEKFQNLYSFAIDSDQTLRQTKINLHANFKSNLSIEAEQELRQLCAIMAIQKLGLSWPYKNYCCQQVNIVNLFKKDRENKEQNSAHHIIKHYEKEIKKIV